MKFIRILFIKLFCIALTVVSSFAQDPTITTPPPTAGTLSPRVAQTENFGPCSDCNVNGGDFQTITTGVANCYDKTETGVNVGTHFNSNCVPNWYSSHGTPEIIRSGTNRYAMMWTGAWWGSGYPNRGEGIFTRVCIDPRYRYTLRLKIRTAASQGLDKIYVYLTNGLEPNTSVNMRPGQDNSYDIPTVSSKQLILELTNYARNSFDEVFVDFQPNTTYRQIWIYAYENTGGHSQLFVDDVLLNSCAGLPTAIDYSFTNTLPTITRAQDYITAADATTVEAGQGVTFRAGNQVKLLPGFTAVTGSTFIAATSPCSITGCPYPRRLSFDDHAADEENSLVHIHPNPSDGSFQVELPSDSWEKGFLSVINAQGKEVHHAVINKMNGNKFDLNLYGVPPGVYLVKFDIDDRKFTRRIVVTR